VLKPVDGSGSLDTFFLADAASIPALEDRPSDSLLQPFLDGIPMSASFLVSCAGTPWLIGVGRQTMRIWKSRFYYCGGVIPETCPEALPILRRAVESIPGLSGFVGVDFLWVPQGHTATVLEINPRVTTSYVGLSRLLPPGRLARAWLAACGVTGTPEPLLATLAEEVQNQPPISFNHEGDVWLEKRR
jgi:predicted ATP-grasp superfamily ATP-dependent carboligase